MSKKDSKKDTSHVEEVDLDTIVSSDDIFDLGKIREKSILIKDTPSASVKDEEPSDDEDMSLPEIEEIMVIEDDILPLKDEDLLLFEEDLSDFEDEEEEDGDEEEEDGEGAGRKKRER